MSVSAVDALSSADIEIDFDNVCEIHTSMRKSYRSCRRRWDWIANDRWYPKVTEPYFEFGIAYHKAMETYYEPSTWTWNRSVVEQLAVKAFVDSCNDQRSNMLAYAKEVGRGQFLPEEVEADYDERVRLGKGMLAYYFRETVPKLDRGWKPVKVEIPFKVPILDPDAGFQRGTYLRCTHPKHSDQHSPNAIVVYAGRVDCLAEDIHGDYYCTDWKTSSMIRDGDDAFMDLDDQIGSYVWALRWECKLPVRGFVYHQQRKGFPQPPTQNKQRRLGCLYSVSKSQTTDYDTYVATVRENDRDAYIDGLYDEFLTFLREEGPIFYDRRVVFKSDEELISIGENIAYEAAEMVSPHTRTYPNPGRFHCRNCAFRQPCMEKYRRGDWEYSLESMFDKRDHYYVREQASTETKGAE